MALLSADNLPGPALRLPCARTVGSGKRASVRPQQAAARPVWKSLSRRVRLRPRYRAAVALLSDRSRGHRDARATGLAGAHHDHCRHQPLLRLGFGPPTTHPVPRDSHLRGTRQGHDADSPRDTRGTSGHLCGAGASRGDRPPAFPRCHRHRTHAGTPVLPRQPADRAGAAKLLGIQHLRVPRTACRIRVFTTCRRSSGRVQGNGARTPRGRHRGDSRRRLQPHRRGRPYRTDTELPRYR
ncbi:Uncharacterised protein [Mycobacteroides abscessus subsp. abscessus]|nr:Uncharacterised protein [Mycobacteroides abscessus subsp. abscessus]